MKTLYIIVTGIMLSVSSLSFAQDAAPIEDELPVIGVRYYFYPNLDAYFDTHTNLYIFQKNGSWIKSKDLAPGYRGYSVMNTIRVEITDYNGDQPFTKLAQHQEKHPKKYTAKRRPPQKKPEVKLAYN